MAQTVEIPINSKPYQNVDSFTLNDFSDVLFDGVIEAVGNTRSTRKRQGLAAFAKVGTYKEIDGLYWWETQSLLIIVSEGSIYKLASATDSVASITGDKLEDSGRVTFADNGTTLVMANGGRMVYTNGTANTVYIADADAPTTVTHIAFLDQWLLANKTNTATFYYADFTSAPTTWLALNVFTAEASPDYLVSLYVNRRTIVLGGTLSTEFWFDDGVTPFSRIQGSTTARGVNSSYATVFANEVGYFLDNRRKLVKLDGITPIVISTPFDRTIQNFTTVTDVLMDYITVDGQQIILIAFPTEKRTLVYDIAGDYWCEWSFWDSGTNDRARFAGNCYAYARTWNKHLFGRVGNDQIYDLNNTTYSDAGVDIHYEKKTGHIDHGVLSKRKRSYKLTLRLKTGFGLGAGGASTPYMLLRWKDNNNTGWSNWRYVSLKIQGDRSAVVTIYNLGSYYTRQWHFKQTDQVPFTISSAYEEVDISEF